MAARLLAALAIFVLGIALLLAPASNAGGPVGLGSAADFAILAGAGITNTGDTAVTGDIGSFPTDSQTGFETVDHTGENHGNDEVAALAKDDLATAFDEAAGLASTGTVGQLGGLTLGPGVYEDDGQPDSMSLIGTLTLDGMNQTDPVFVFQSGTTLVLGAGAEVVLVNGATSCNVFWQVGSSATLGAGSHLEGTVLAMDAITMGAGASVDGRVLARVESVTMINNTITNLPCETATSTTGPSTSATETASSSSTTSPPPTSPPPTPPPPTTPPPTTPPPTSPPPTPPPPTSPPPTSPPPTSSPPVTTPPTSSTSTTGPTPPLTTPPETPPPSTEIPVFPTPLAGLLAAIGTGGALLLMLRRSP